MSDFLLTKISEIELAEVITDNDMLLISQREKFLDKEQYFSKKLSFEQLSVAVLSSLSHTYALDKYYQELSNLYLSSYTEELSALITKTNENIDLSVGNILDEMMITWSGSMELYRLLSTVLETTKYYDTTFLRYKPNVIFYIVDLES